MAFTIELRQGRALVQAIQLNQPGGASAAGQFTGAESLAATVWNGDQSAALATPAAAWLSAANAQIQVSFLASDTASLAPGAYSLAITATLASETIDLLPDDALVVIVAAPGTALERPAYCSLQDLRDIAPWVDDVGGPPFAAGFPAQLAGARDWIDEAIVRQYRGGNVTLLGEHGIALSSWATGGGRRMGLENRWLVQQLAANRLLLRPRVVKLAAYYALSLICESLMSGDNKYRGLAAQYRNEANTLLSCSTLEIDLDGDGYGEVPIVFTSSNTLFG